MKRAISISPAPPGTRSGLTESIATRSATRSRSVTAPGHAAMVIGHDAGHARSPPHARRSEPRFEVQDVPDPVPAAGRGRRRARHRRAQPPRLVDLARALHARAGHARLRRRGRVAAVGAGVAGPRARRRGRDRPGARLGRRRARGCRRPSTSSARPRRARSPSASSCRRSTCTRSRAALSWEEAAAFPLAGLTAWRATVTCARRSARAAPADHRRRLRRLDVLPADRARARRPSLGHVGQRRQDRALRRARRPRAASATTIPMAASRCWRRPAARASHAVVDSFGGDGWAQALRALARGGVLVNYGDTGGDEATIPVAALYWQWRSLIGTTMGSPREFRALCDAHGAGAWRPAIDSVHALDDIASGRSPADRPGALRQGRPAHRLTRAAPHLGTLSRSEPSSTRLKEHP